MQKNWHLPVTSHGNTTCVSVYRRLKKALQCDLVRSNFIQTKLWPYGKFNPTPYSLTNMNVILVTEDCAMRMKIRARQICNNHMNLTNLEATDLSPSQEGCLTKTLLALSEATEYSQTSNLGFEICGLRLFRTSPQTPKTSLDTNIQDT